MEYKCLDNGGKHISGFGFYLRHKLTSPLSKEKQTLAHSYPRKHFLSFEVHRLDGTTIMLSSFPLSKATPPLFLTSHNISCYLPPSLTSCIKWYCLYTPSIYHPISHFPRLVYLPWVLGRHEGTFSAFFSLSSSFAFLPSLLPSNHCWLLVPIDIRELIKPWRSCLIYAEGVWWWRGSIVKTQVIYCGTCCHILQGLAKIQLEAASACRSISLHPLPSLPAFVW